MLEYSRIDVSEGIDVVKTDSLRRFIICHYWYFLNINSRFQPGVCNGCHDLIEKVENFNNATIFSVKNIFLYMS